MKKLVAGFAVAAAVLTAADLASASNRTARAPAASAAPNWSGFYFGLHAGWGSANSSNATSRTDSIGGVMIAPVSFDVGDSGALAGGQIGYNWQVGHWVFGLEADLSGAGIDGFESRPAVAVFGFGSPTTHFTADNFMRQEVNWLASARGRLGYAFGSGLIYATGGAAWANVDYQANTTGGLLYCGGVGCAWPAAVSDTLSGWVIGGGYEWAAASNWTLRGEYLFYSFDGPSSTVSRVVSNSSCPTCRATYTWGDLDIHTFRFGLNYKWDSAPAAQMQAQPAPAAKDWTGFYAGLHGGWAFARSDAASNTAINSAVGSFYAPAAFDLNDNGPLFGGQVGYNWQIKNWVLGVEADLSGAGIRGFQSQPAVCVAGYIFCGSFSGPVLGAGSFVRQDVNWLASLRGRIGHVWGSGLIYVTGGAAFANVDHEANTSGMLACVINPGCPFPVAFNKTRAGWTLGGGYEWPVWSNWTLRGEYLFYNFDGVSAVAAPTPAATGGCLTGRSCSVTYRWNDLDIHSLRVGLNYTW